MPNEPLLWAQIAVVLANVGGLIWIVKQLTEKNGSLAPRWAYDLEHGGRVDAEKRTDEYAKLFEAALTEVRKARGAP